jgi:uncharacterized RDD family membrane protein YckC
MNLAHRHSRLAAYLVDTVILGTINSIIFGVVFGIFVLFAGISVTNIGDLPSLQAAVGLTFLIVIAILSLVLSIGVLIYYSYFLSKNAQTPGMKFVGIKAQKEDGSNLTFQEAVIRYIALSILGLLGASLTYIPYVGILLYIPAMFGIYFWCLVDKKQQNVYDMIHHVVYTNANEDEKRSEIVIGSYLGCGCLAILITLGAFFAIGYSTMSKTNSSSKPTPGISQPSETSFEKSNRLEKECMENNEAQNFTSLSGYCSCVVSTDLDQRIPDSKKEEIKIQECGFYGKSNAKTTSKPVTTTPAAKATTKAATVTTKFNEDVYASNYSGCMKNPDTYVGMKFPGKKATSGVAYCNCMATVAGTYSMETAAIQKEELVKACSVYTK